MPLGEPVREIGLLLEAPTGPVLRRDDGGTWRLESVVDLGAHLGKRVEVQGVRDGFDFIAVTGLRVLSGGARVEYREPFFATWQFAAGAAAVLVGLPLAAAVASLLG